MVEENIWFHQIRSVPEWWIFHNFYMIIFTMLDRNFSLITLRMHQNERLLINFMKHSQCLKKIFDLSQNEKNFYLILKFHHGWRKFWFHRLKNALEWKILEKFFMKHSPWFKKIFDFINWTGSSQIRHSIFHHFLIFSEWMRVNQWQLGSLPWNFNQLILKVNMKWG